MAIGIIVICLLQGGKTEGASGAITGGGINVFVQQKERGSDKVLSIVTMCLAVVFFLFAMMINIFA
ncbi:MAG: preprotein translocase subunit SecG [Coprobacillus sp.]|nr:preprotein translocase subunit SecG [Coprobacillus sp.]